MDHVVNCNGENIVVESQEPATAEQKKATNERLKAYTEGMSKLMKKD